MYTQCPQCLTYFQVTPEHLRIAHGNVRCGQCRNVFSALGNLTEEPPQAAYENNDDDIDEEIFIDEGELDIYNEEYVEEYAEDQADEFTDEYSEEFYIVEDEIDETEEAFQDIDAEPSAHPKSSANSPAPEPPINLEKTNILPPPQPQPQAQRSAPAQNRTLPNSQKLSEAIATIEKLKQSYTNLSIRQLDQREPQPEIKVTPANNSVLAHPEPHVQETKHNQHSAEVDPLAPFAQPPAVEPEPAVPPPQPPAKQPPVDKASAPRQQAKPKPPSDVGFDHYPEDDGVDYEEALNALNDLKILEEDNEEQKTKADAPVNHQKSPKKSATKNRHKGKTKPQPDEPVVEFSNDLAIDEADIADENHALIIDEALREELLSTDSAIGQDDGTALDNGVKVKSLDRGDKGKVKPDKPTPGGKKSAKSKRKSSAENKPSKVANKPVEEAPKFLPAIPKQLLEDFQHGHGDNLHHPLSITLWSIGSIAMMVVFLLQTVYFKHNDLARVPTLRPWIETFCGYMSCDLSLPSDVRQLELVSQDIRSHPKVKSALLVTTTIINNASFVQSYPGLQITFSDLNGQKVAMRRFAPHEYLAPGVSREDGMPPNTPIQVELEMMDPGTNAVNFEFDFIPLI